MPSPTTKRRLVASGLVPVVIGFGLFCKAYRGIGSEWVNNWGPASVAYVLLFMLLAFIVVPRPELIWHIAIGVCIGTCLVELLQLWHPPFLESARATRLGRLILGTTFSWGDFPAYILGCLLSVPMLRAICRFS